MGIQWQWQLGDGTNTDRSTPTQTSSLGTDRTAVAITAGLYHTCAILDDGSVSCWGYNYNGQIGDGTTTDRNTPTPTSSLGTDRTAVAIDSGYFHTCAILDDGSVSCWGYNNYGQLGDGTTTDRNTPTQTSSLGTDRTAVAITAAVYHTCAILDDGSVSCWGWNIYGQIGDGTNTDRNTPTQTSSLGTDRTAVAINAGGIHTCAILDDGSVSCWGYNYNGQIGDGTTTDRNTPTQTSSLGTGRTAALDSNYLPGGTSQTECAAGTYQASTGQSSCTDASAGYYVPTTGQTTQTACAAGTYQSATGQTSCDDADPGYYVDSTTGIAQTTQTACAVGTYQASAGQSSCTDASAGYYVDSTASTQQIMCSATTFQSYTGQTYCNAGSLGHYIESPPIADIPCPAGTYLPGVGDSLLSCHDADAGYYVPTTGQTTQTACLAGTYNANTGSTSASDCLDADAGYYVDSTLGAAQTTQTACLAGTYNANTASTTSSDCLDASAGHYVDSTAGTAQTTQTACIAGTYNANTGSTTSSDCLDADAGYYVDSTASTAQTACAAGTYQSATGQTSCTDASAGYYVLDSRDHNSNKIASGANHNCAILDDGSVSCWGYNGQGQLGDGTTTSRNTPTQTSSLGTDRTAVAITAGSDHTCAILDDGSVSCWGYNGYGRLGDGTTTNRNTPTQTSSLGTDRTAVAITAGAYHTCAILDDGSVSCWGWNNHGQLGDGTNTDRNTPTQTSSLGTDRTAVAITVGTFHTCAILDDGSVSCWGYNGYGQLGDGTTTDRNTPTQTSSLGTDRTAVAITAGSISHMCNS